METRNGSIPAFRQATREFPARDSTREQMNGIDWTRVHGRGGAGRECMLSTTCQTGDRLGLWIPSVRTTSNAPEGLVGSCSRLRSAGFLWGVLA